MARSESRHFTSLLGAYSSGRGVRGGGTAISESDVPFTVLIPASPVPSHPQTVLVERAIRSLGLLQSAGRPEVIICHDPPRPSADARTVTDFERYLRRLERKARSWPGTRIVVAPEWGNLTGNLRHGLSFVRTEFVLILQHDFYFVREVDMDALVRAMRSNPQLKYVRFNKRSNLPRRADGRSDERISFFQEETHGGIALCRTLSWSDIPHICRVDYYRDVVFPLVGTSKTFPEAVCNPLVNRSTHETFGTYIWGELGSPKAVGHANGRALEREGALRRAYGWVASRTRLRSRAKFVLSSLHRHLVRRSDSE